MNADYAKNRFPCRLWDAGKKGLTLSSFEWDNESGIMLYGQKDYRYGEKLERPVIEDGNPTRLYSLSEIKGIMSKRGMTVIDSFSDFHGAKSGEDGIQLMVYSRRN